MLVSDFDYHLPEELIAQHPAVDRAGARMLALDRTTGRWKDAHFRDLPQMLQPGDVLVVNDSRVLPARLFARRRILRGATHTGKIEVLLTEPLGNGEWKSLVKPGKKVQVGDRLIFLPRDEHGLPRDEPGSTQTLEAEVTARGDFGERTLRFDPDSGPGLNPGDFFERLQHFGHVPLPPYIRRDYSIDDALEDHERYQTIYAQPYGSVAVPTAGLHFTQAILEEIKTRGVEVCSVTLHVGLGTFQPLRVERVEEVALHAERYTLPETTATALNHAKAEGRRIVAAGTTTVRTLEHCAASADGKPLEPHDGKTNIFLSPGHRFRLVDAMLTNFHLPQSSLLMLVSAFAGLQPTLAAYQHAVASRYRFFSYGDCMFIS